MVHGTFLQPQAIESSWSLVRDSIEEQLIWTDETLDSLTVSLEAAPLVDPLHRLTGEWNINWDKKVGRRQARCRGREALRLAWALSGGE